MLLNVIYYVFALNTLIVLDNYGRLVEIMVPDWKKIIQNKQTISDIVKRMKKYFIFLAISPSPRGHRG